MFPEDDVSCGLVKHQPFSDLKYCGIFWRDQDLQLIARRRSSQSTEKISKNAGPQDIDTCNNTERNR
jgi:hypothetical protein